MDSRFRGNDRRANLGGDYGHSFVHFWFSRGTMCRERVVRLGRRRRLRMAATQGPLAD